MNCQRCGRETFGNLCGDCKEGFASITKEVPLKLKELFVIKDSTGRYFLHVSASGDLVWGNSISSLALHSEREVNSYLEDLLPDGIYETLRVIKKG